MTEFYALNRKDDDWYGEFTDTTFDFTDYFTFTCTANAAGDSCNVCSDSAVGGTAADTCPSSCAPFTYGAACTDCPSHCTKGCDNSGAC
jgi:hypothetical protein